MPRTRPKKSAGDPEPDGNVSGAMTNHESKVLENRKGWFLSIGFDDTAAALLAYSNISPHGMKTLLDNGCTHDLAMRILAGTDANGNDDLNAIGHSIAYESDAA